MFHAQALPDAIFRSNCTFLSVAHCVLLASGKAAYYVSLCHRGSAIESFVDSMILCEHDVGYDLFKRSFNKYSEL